MMGYDRTIWPEPRSPWPSWHLNETLYSPPKTQWNPPSLLELKPGESAEFGLQFTLASAGPRTVDEALVGANRALVKAVPGYVLAADMTSARLYVQPPTGQTVQKVGVTPTGVISVTKSKNKSEDKSSFSALDVKVLNAGWGDVRVAVTFSDGSQLAVHYFAMGRPERFECISIVIL